MPLDPTRRALLRGSIAAAALAVAVRPAFAAGPRLEAWRTPGCGCCEEWARHLERAGYAVTLHDAPDLAAVRARLGVPADLAGCHSGLIDGYVVEGHVPAAAVRKLLAERPALRGIAVSGMPMGSPGMEVEGMPADRFDVVAFRPDGSRNVFMHF